MDTITPRKKHPRLAVKKHPRVRWNYFTGSYTKRDMRPLKPERFRDWMTIQELSQHTGKTQKWLLKLEKEGRIPQASRLQKRSLGWRLWSPEQVDEIHQILATHKVGRPRKNAYKYKYSDNGVDHQERAKAHAQGKLHVHEIDIDDIVN
jgi:predicted DNA-binding transcriptional regulator AlpA